MTNINDCYGCEHLFSLADRTISVGLVNVTPMVASSLLELNKHNRKLTTAKVDQIAADIQAGRFKFNGAPIVVDERPEVVDGQHRLHGIVKSGMTVPMLIVNGVATDVTDTIDTLSKPRSVSDILTMKYQHDVKNRSYVDGIASILMAGTTGTFTQSKPAIAAYADSMIEQLLEWAVFAKSIQASSQKVVLQRHSIRSAMSASATGALCIQMAWDGASEILIREFFTRVATGSIADSDQTNIVPLLRRRQAGGILLGGNGVRSHPTALFTECATYVIAYNRWVAGEQQQQLKGYSTPVRDFSYLPKASRFGASI